MRKFSSQEYENIGVLLKVMHAETDITINQGYH